MLAARRFLISWRSELAAAGLRRADLESSILEISSSQLPMTSSNYQKYQTGNPLMQAVIGRFLRRLCAKIVELRPATILDLGCGEGLVAREIGRQLPDVHYVGIDLSEEAVRTARELNPKFEFRQGSLLDYTGESAADLVLCVEVLEHLERPELGLDRIVAATRENALVSVPWEPYFRLGNLLRGN